MSVPPGLLGGTRLPATVMLIGSTAVVGLPQHGRHLLCSDTPCNQTRAFGGDDDGGSGTTVGIALGILACFAVVVIIVFMEIRRKRREELVLKHRGSIRNFYHADAEGPSRTHFRRSTIARLERSLTTTTEILSKANIDDDANSDAEFSEYLDSTPPDDVTESTDSDVLIAISKDASECGAKAEYLLDMVARLKVTISGLLAEVQKQGFTSQYLSIQTVGITQSSSVAQLEHNDLKNRYTNVLAYDHSRVVLPIAFDDPTTDYINANYVDGYFRPQAYIAAQGPVPNSFGTFWRMIWHENVTIIVMLTQEVENDIVKCDRYWPDPMSDSPEQQKVFWHGFSVEHVETKYQLFWIERQFLLKYEGSERCVTQLCFTAWPDHGVPESANNLLLLRLEVHRLSRGATVPIVIHCSAGVGRTGTYIALDKLLDASVNNDTELDVDLCVRDMRMARNLMVQTEAQYLFIFAALLHGLNLLLHRAKTASLGKEKEESEYDYSVSEMVAESAASDTLSSHTSEVTEYSLNDSGVEFRIKSCRRVNPLYRLSSTMESPPTPPPRYTRPPSEEFDVDTDGMDNKLVHSSAPRSVSFVRGRSTRPDPSVPQLATTSLLAGVQSFSPTTEEVSEDVIQIS